MNESDDDFDVTYKFIEKLTNYELGLASAFNQIVKTAD